MPLDRFVALFERPVTFTWRSLLVATLSELEQELSWGASRPESVAASMNIPPSSVTLRTNGAFEACLTEFELENMNKYRIELPRRIYSLKQNFEGGFGAHST